MPPDRGRASKACTSCRRQKTRCYESGISGTPCLRCERLNQRCSFIDDVVTEEPVPSGSNTDTRLERLEKTVSHLLNRLGDDSSQLAHDTPAEFNPAQTITRDSGNPIPKGNDPAAAPVMVIRDLAADTGIELANTTQNVSIDRLVSADLALELISIFSENYGRWVLFDPDDDAHSLLLRVRKSPLLFCACCLIAVRHTSQDLAANLAPKLYESARSLIQSALLVSPQPIEFFQAVIVLCMWSTTVGQVPLSIDSWLLSGFALQHCQSSSLFSVVTNPSSAASEIDKSTLNIWFLWNHICLVHLHYCVGTSRRSMLQDWHIARCRAIVASDRATNYELRMVAEIHLYRTVYDLLTGLIDISQSVAGLLTWRKEWQFVLEQPRAQFLMMGFHFSHLLLYDQFLKAKSVRSQEAVVSEMITHATAIIRLAIDTMDERTRHLSDHIYHMITFAAVIICRIMGAPEHYPEIAYKAEELDTLISSLVQWLQSIGLPCHAAHTFGTIIAQVQQKARPQVDANTSSPVQAGDILPDEFTRFYFPEFLGVGATPNGSWDLAPNFSFFSQDYPLPDGIN
ncbi:hypothetical protein ASPVEDRAFT_83854 [Aspergillus versicolor CBS 583.65]|uniref:Transcriptional activator of proteases prtT n=1 Tax=Aspergillus versicolor CBS 583.65 TaxID=1036611 RepID=A0A1L9PLF3_ASPVE|nr:uncharacterized protein ASPVEDRAFT_83854 [Aspergillus versicolor CBS 583.65]OJJ02344.1 hypothetical protein ASPVEDRAFT_83854 [Aspergillus versicolor CBS 583.65]